MALQYVSGVKQVNLLRLQKQSHVRVAMAATMRLCCIVAAANMILTRS